MKKVISAACSVLMPLVSFQLFASDAAPAIKDYEPWKYTVLAGMGSCGECDPSDTFKYNHYLR
ncbi:MAG TPA: hypothetical protein P5511_04245 [Candidatus Goldiibacteriota bacterium]|nr:hypothetical protein [Candidatus Goldiibacteriota bacterium]